MSSPVDQIKERLNIVDIIAAYVHLERAGSNYKARCPFHNERTPSFFVSPARQSFYCFGCGEGGDMFTFIQEFEGLDFSGALKILAEQAGVTLEAQNTKERSEKEYLYRVLDAAVRYYEKQRERSPEAEQYLKERGVRDETMRHFRIGYAPTEWDALTRTFTQKGISGSMLEKAGLVSQGRNGYYDRFRGRVMFPITDSSGRPVGFSGRILPQHEDTLKGNTAKYINTPETVLFDKSRTLFGFAGGKYEIRKQGECVVVEGQMDVVLSHQEGITNVVAASGTALSRPHVQLIKRLSDRIVFAFDADAAGLQAAQRGIDIALSEGCHVAVASLPADADPADLVREDAARWKEIIAGATHIIPFLLDAIVAGARDPHDRAKQVREQVLPYVASVENAIEKAHFVQQVARTLVISEEAVWDELAQVVPKHTTDTEEASAETHAGPRATGTRAERITRVIAGILWWQEGQEEPRVDTASNWEKLKRIIGEEAYGRLDAYDAEARKDAIFQAEISYEAVSDLSAEVGDLLAHLEREYLQDAFARVMQELKQAEHEGDEERTFTLLKQCQELSRKLGHHQHGN